jgi:hypothetical protein
LIELLIFCFTQFSTVYVLFDALDERGHEEVNSVIAFLQEIRQSDVKLFVTTRPHIQALEPVHEQVVVCNIYAD